MLVERPSLSARDGYDRWAPSYDDYDNPLVALELPVVRELLGDVAGLRVADIGCGTGRHALRMSAAGATVTGVDFSAGMLAVLRGKATREVAVVEHDLRLGIPLPDASFDRVLCCLVLEHMPDLVATFAELARICVPGGHVIVTDLHPEMTRQGIHARFREADGTKHEIVGAHRPISAYVAAGVRAGLLLDRIEERVMDPLAAVGSRSAQKYIGQPLLLAMRLARP